MSKKRSVDTHFWNDTYVAELDPIEKVLFLYFLTNPLTNMLGVYEIPLRRIAFDTGVDKDMVNTIIERFDNDGKFSYVDGYLVVHKFLEHQKLNSNMKTSAKNEFNDLPDNVKRDSKLETVRKALEGLEILSKSELELESELESELEGEYESEESQTSETPEFDDATREIATHLLERIVQWEPEHRYGKNPPSLTSWHKAIDRAMRLDGRTPEQLKVVIDYIFTQDTEVANFWKPNIQSGGKLREKFDQVVGQIKNEINNNGKNKSRYDAFYEKLF